MAHTNTHSENCIILIEKHITLGKYNMALQNLQYTIRPYHNYWCIYLDVSIFVGIRVEWPKVAFRKAKASSPQYNDDVDDISMKICAAMMMAVCRVFAYDDDDDEIETTATITMKRTMPDFVCVTTYDEPCRWLFPVHHNHTLSYIPLSPHSTHIFRLLL